MLWRPHVFQPGTCATFAVYIVVWNIMLSCPWILTELKLAEAELDAQTHNLTEAQERWECSERGKNLKCIGLSKS